MFECVSIGQIGNPSKMQDVLNNTGFQTHPVKYLDFEPFCFPPKKKCFEKKKWSEWYTSKNVHLLYYLLNTKANLSQIWMDASVWIESTSSSKNNGCRKSFWIPDMQDLFLLIHRGCHCLQQKKKFFSSRSVGTSYARDCQPVVLVLNPKTSVQSLLFREEEVQSAMLLSWTMSLDHEHTLWELVQVVDHMQVWKREFLKYFELLMVW